MSTLLATRTYAIPVQTVASGSITSSFVAAGAAMPAPIRILKIFNTTNADIYISYDGVTQNDVLPAGVHMVLDITANKVTEDGNFLAQGTIIYLEYVSAAPTSGNVYISAYYSSNKVE